MRMRVVRKILAVLMLAAEAALLTSCAAQKVTVPASVAAASLPTGSVAHVDRRIATAYYAADVPALQSLRLALEQRVEHDPQAGKYVWYDLGFANFALADRTGDMDHFDACIDAAERALKKAIALDARFADAHALLGLSYDVEISRHHWKGMTLGIMAGRAIGKAFALAPTNPRVVLIKGFSDYGTPAMFGGDKQRGRQEYAEAVRLFDRHQTSDPEAPTWGKAQALRWLADVEAREGDFEQARGHYQAALKLFPAFKGAKFGLNRLLEKMHSAAD